MTYKEFMDWCNNRAADGCWGLNTAKACIQTIDIVQSAPFWRRKNVWKACEQQVVEKYVNPTNEKIREYLEGLNRMVTDEKDVRCGVL